MTTGFITLEENLERHDTIGAWAVTGKLGYSAKFSRIYLDLLRYFFLTHGWDTRTPWTDIYHAVILCCDKSDYVEDIGESTIGVGVRMQHLLDLLKSDKKAKVQKSLAISPFKRGAKDSVVFTVRMAFPSMPFKRSLENAAITDDVLQKLFSTHVPSSLQASEQGLLETIPGLTQIGSTLRGRFTASALSPKSRASSGQVVVDHAELDTLAAAVGAVGGNRDDDDTPINVRIRAFQSSGSELGELDNLGELAEVGDFSLSANVI